MARVNERDDRLVRALGPVLLGRMDELDAQWRRHLRLRNPPDLPAMTRTAVHAGLVAGDRVARLEAVEHEERPLEEVVDAVLAWQQVVHRCLARYAVEDVLAGSSALDRFLQRLIVRVARRQAEVIRERRAEVVRDLAQADRLKSDLVSMISHDLQTPLTAIQGCAVSLLRLPMDASEQRRMLEMIVANSERLSRLITQMLDLSRLEAGAVELNVQPVALGRIAERVAASFPAPVEVASDPGAGAAEADPDAVERILVNLVDNALKSGGERPPLLRITRDGSNVRIEVSDSGRGVPPERRDGLFGRFFQVDPSADGRRTGTGLGLAIVKGLAEAMGGQAGFVPKEPKGSTFWVSFPASIRF